VEAEDEILFSESNSRLLLEVREDKASMFERVIRGVKAARVGWVTEEKNLKIIGLKGHAVLEESVSALRNAWKSTFNWWMT
jgi:phosphoribosylformylglycinamidine synthase